MSDVNFIIRGISFGDTSPPVLTMCSNAHTSSRGQTKGFVFVTKVSFSMTNSSRELFIYFSLQHNQYNDHRSVDFSWCIVNTGWPMSKLRVFNNEFVKGTTKKESVLR